MIKSTSCSINLLHYSFKFYNSVIFRLCPALSLNDLLSPLAILLVLLISHPSCADDEHSLASQSAPPHQHSQHCRCITKQQQITTHLNQTCDFTSRSLSSSKYPPLHTPVSAQPSFRGDSKCTPSKPSQKDMWFCFMCCLCVSVHAHGCSLGGQQSLGAFLNSVPSYFVDSVSLILELMRALLSVAVLNFWCVMEI